MQANARSSPRKPGACARVVEASLDERVAPDGASCCWVARRETGAARRRAALGSLCALPAIDTTQTGKTATARALSRRPRGRTGTALPGRAARTGALAPTGDSRVAAGPPRRDRRDRDVA